MAWLFLICGLALAGAGLMLRRSFRSPQEDLSRFHPAGAPLRGLLAFAGILALVFGLSATLVGIMLLFR